MKLKVVVHKAEEGGYWAEIPERLCPFASKAFSEVDSIGPKKWN